MVEALFSFFRRVPLLDVLFLLTAWLLMVCWWRSRDVGSAEQADSQMRQIGASAVTNQINALLTAASIVVAGVGSVLAIGLGREFPKAALEHFLFAGAAALASIILGVYTLGYLPSVIHRLDVTRKAAVMVACSMQIILLVLSAARFLGGLWQFSRHLGK